MVQRHPLASSWPFPYETCPDLGLKAVSPHVDPSAFLPSCRHLGTKLPRLRNCHLFHMGVLSGIKIKPAWSLGWGVRNTSCLLILEVGVFVEQLLWQGQCLPPLHSIKPSLGADSKWGGQQAPLHQGRRHLNTSWQTGDSHTWGIQRSAATGTISKPLFGFKTRGVSEPVPCDTAALAGFLADNFAFLLWCT